jgi:hypothetical protein
MRSQSSGRISPRPEAKSPVTQFGHCAGKRLANLQSVNDVRDRFAAIGHARIQEFHLVRYHAIYEDAEDCLTEKL